MKNSKHFFRFILIFGYASIILIKTVVGRPVQTVSVFKPLFWELQNGYWEDIALNILLFIPLGFLIGSWRGLLMGFIFSVAIEVIQYCGRIGFCEMDDVLNNSIGTGIGILCNFGFKYYIDWRKRK